MSFRSAILALLGALALVACASNHAKLDLPREQVAEVLGRDEHPVFGMGRDLAFAAVDGKEFGSGIFSPPPRAIDVLPGKHTLRCLFFSTFDGVQGPSGSVDVELLA